MAQYTSKLAARISLLLFSICLGNVHAGNVTFVPYYEPGSAWIGNAAAQDAVENFFDELEDILKTSGSWDSVIEVYLNDDEDSAYASASPGSTETVALGGKSYRAANSWAQLVEGQVNPNGVIVASTGANSDVNVSWNFALSSPETNIGLLRHEMHHGLGMIGYTDGIMPTMATSGAVTVPASGTTTWATVHDSKIVDLNGDSILQGGGTQPWNHTSRSYAVDSNWDDANGSGLQFPGVADDGSTMLLPLTSYNAGATYAGAVDNSHIDIVSYANAHPTWHTLEEVDRAYLRGLGYNVPSSVVVAPAPVLNISTRGNIGTGDNVMIGGIIIGGTGTKQVLITGRGQSIPASVPNRITDPQLRVVDASGTVIATSDNWVGEADEAAIAATSAGGPGHASDAAVLLNLAPGAYTAIVDGVGGATGIGIVEIFDVDLSSSAKILNLSTRGNVGTGDNVLIGGVIVGGANPAQLGAVFRGRGPSIPATVPNRLNDPVLTMFDATSSPFLSVDDWAFGASGGALSGAYSSYAPSSPFDSATVQSLAPGAYTAILQDSGSGTGIGIVEVFVTD